MFYRIVVAIIRVLLYFIMPMKVINKEKAVYGRGVVLAANHQSAWDPIYIAMAYKGNLNFMAKMELFKFKPFGAVLYALGAFPVNRASADLKAIKTALGLLKKDKAMLMFPEGTRVQGEEHTDAKNGVAMFALKTKSLIQPIALFGGFKPFRRTYVVFGDPVAYEEYYNQKLDSEIYSVVSDDVLARIQKIAVETKKDLQKNEK